jgi:hypothetical protein
MAAIGKTQVQAAAVVPQPVAKFIKRLGAREAAPAPIPGIDETKEQDDEELIIRDGCGWHNGFEQFPCSSSSSLHLPFRSLFKLPALLINTLAFTTQKVRAAAVVSHPLTRDEDGDVHGGIPTLVPDVENTKAVDDEDLIVRNGCGWHNGFEQFPCSAASGVKVPSIFTIPALFFTTLTTKHARAAAVPVDTRDAASIPIATTHGSEERDDDEVVTENDLIARQDCNEIHGVWVGCPQGPPTLWSAANSLKVHPVLAIPSRVFNALTAILDTPYIHGLGFLVQKRGFTDGAGASKGEMSTEAFWDLATNVGLSRAGVWAGALCAGLGFAWLVL